METFDKVCGDNRGLLAVTKKQNGMFMRCDDSPDSFHGPVVYTKSINMITCWTFNMLPTRLSPLLWIINILCLWQLLFLPYVVLPRSFCDRTV